MNKSSRQLLWAGWKPAMVILSLGLFVSPVSADTTVVPGDYANASGNNEDSAPLGADHQHFQQIFSSSLLQNLNVGDQISALGFRLSSGQPSIVSQTIPNYMIGMGSAALAPANMSATFADNRSLDFTTVRSGSLVISAGDFLGGPGLNNFGYIQFDTPYTYNGQDLLIEISYDAFPSGGANVDAAYPYDPSKVRAAFGSADNATTADVGVFDGGIIMSLMVTPTPVPEPSTLALVAIGLAGFPMVRFFSSKRR